MPDDPFAAYQKPATVPGDPFAAYSKPVQPVTLPDVTNQDIKSAGRKALDYLPAVGATAGALLAPEAFWPAVGAAALGGGAGEAIRQGTLAATGSEDAPQSFGQAATEVGKSAAEQGLFEAGGRAVAYPIEKFGKKWLSPSRLYRRDLKPSTALTPEESAARVQTGLREGIPLSEEGYQEAVARSKGIGAETTAMLSGTPRGMIEPLDVANRLDSLEQFYAKQALPDADLQTVRAAKQQYLEKHGAQFDEKTGQMVVPPTAISPIEAQEEKQATYAINRKKYEQAKRIGAAPMSDAQDQTEKALARGLKEEIVKLYPELASENARQADLIALEDSLRRFIGREGNKNAFGLRATIMGAGAITGMMSGHPQAGAGAGMLGAALTLMDVPEIQSRIAIALHHIGQTALGKAAQEVTPTRTIPLAVRFGKAIYQANQPMQRQPVPPPE